MKTIPERYRLPLVALASVVVAVLVVGAILLVGGSPQPSGSPSPTPASPSPSPTDPGSTPESATRAFFAAFADARRSDDPTLVQAFVTSTDSSAYKTAVGFLAGQKEAGKASVITVNELADLTAEIDADQAIVTFRHRVEGFDIDLDTGQPLESPTALPDMTVRVRALMVGGRWLVDQFENVP